MTLQGQAILLRAIEDGLPLKQAAQLAGISYDTLNRWRIRGEADFAPPEFRQFCMALRQAEALGMQRPVCRVSDAGKTDWRAAAWISERRFREEFGRPLQMEHSGPGGKPIQTLTSTIPDGDYEVLRRTRKQEGMKKIVGKLGILLAKAKGQSGSKEGVRRAEKQRARLRE